MSSRVQLIVPSPTASTITNRTPIKEEVEVCVIGMGFSGMAITYNLRKNGFHSIRSFEKGKDVGGTWYWNKYPGCACDIDSYQYSYKFSKELEQEWTWSRRYGKQPEILKYANYVADKFDLRSNTLFETSVNSSIYDETTKKWIVRTDKGDEIHCRFLFLANGALSSPATPGIHISNEFKQRASHFHTHNFNHEIDLKDKVIGIIGTGSTGTQAIPELANVAKKLYVYQRTPAWCAPRKDKEMTKEEEMEIKKDYEYYRLGRLRESSGNLAGNSGLSDVVRDAGEEMPSANKKEPGRYQQLAEQIASDPEAQKMAQEAGGFGTAFSFGAADEDTEANVEAAFGPLNDMKVNQRLQEHLSAKIKEVVHDPDIANALTPDYPVACKRLCITDEYWPTFNKPNVKLYNLKGLSINQVGKNGPEDADGMPLYDEPLDVLITATGFNAMTAGADGSQIGVVQGKNGLTLGEKFKDGYQTYLGMLTKDFPNLFHMVGPQSASVLANMISAGEQQAEWFVDLMVHMRENGFESVDVIEKYEKEWSEHCAEMTKNTVWGGVGGGCRSWYNKANVAERNKDGELLIDVKATGGGDVLVYTGGETLYNEKIEEWKYKGLQFQQHFSMWDRN